MRAAEETTDFTLVSSDDPKLVNRCYLPPSKFHALAGSRIYVEGAIQPVSSQTSNIVDLGSSTVTTGNARDVTKGTTTGTGEAEPETKEPTSALPMGTDLIYGQLLDERGDPDGGVTVRINWFDEKGKNNSFTTKTLTLSEARLMGDPLFEGFYFFSSKRIGSAEYNVTRVETTEKETKPITQQVENDTLLAGREINILPQTTTKESNPLIIALGQFFADYWWWALAPIGIVLLIFLWNWKIKKFVDMILLPAAPKAAQGARDLLKRQAKTFMRTEWAHINIDISAREATSILLGNDDGFAFVETRGELAGVLTLSDLLAALAKDDPQAIRIADLISDPYTILPNTSFGDATLIDARILPVVKNKKILGFVRRQDLLALLDEYYGTHPSSVRKLPGLRHLLSVPTPLFAKDSIRDAVNVVIKEKTSAGVVGTKTDKGYRVLGLVSERVLVEELINFRSTVHQMTIDTAMERVRTIDIDQPVLESIGKLLESERRELVVVEDNLLQGVLTSHILVNELRGALDKII